MNSTWEVERKIYSGDLLQCLLPRATFGVERIYRQSRLLGKPAMPDTNTAAAAGFQNAEAYEKVMGRWSRRLAPLLIRFGGLADGDRVLDVGCGTGSLTFALPEIANIAGITGIDLTESFMEFARSHNTDPRISFQSADAREVPFEGNSF